MAHLGDGLLHEFVDHTPWLAAHPWAISAGVFILAGLYQFTPLKYQCLDQCRSPISFITEHWRGHHQRFHAFLLGVHHGLFCIGCCWSLMLLMFAVGMTNVGWMFLLGMLMAIERNVSWGRRLVAPLGIVLLAAGLLILDLGMGG
jgi:predicted metal-binding membrane protein